MKTVYFVRHAKSSWDDPSLRDLDRPLNPRGFRDAPFMAKLLKAKMVVPGQIISSPAKRAHTTAVYFAKELGLAPEDIMIRREIYEAYTGDVIDLIQSLPDDLDIVLIFGHNPTFTSIANMFSQDYIPNVPTCGITKVVAPVQNWKQFNEQTASLEDFYYPKQYF